MNPSLRRKIDEASVYCGIAEEIIVHFIEEEWIVPIDEEQQVLDEEDVARISLIWELKQEFGVNDEAVPVILHLIDQLNILRVGRS